MSTGGGYAASSLLHCRQFSKFGPRGLEGNEVVLLGESVILHEGRDESVTTGVVSYSSSESLVVDLLLARNDWRHPFAAGLRQAGLLLDPTLSARVSGSDECSPEGMYMDSVKRKRASKMNKHKHRKRRKRERMRK